MINEIFDYQRILMNSEVRQLNDLLVSIYNEIVKFENTAIQDGPFPDLSVTEMHTLESIGRERAKAMNEVAQNLGVTVGTLSVSIKRLVAKGYVEREQDEKDRRLVLVRLTERGRRAERIHAWFHSLLMKATLAKLPPEEIRVLMSALTNLNGFFREYMQKSGN